MEKYGVTIHLEAVGEARAAWNKARREFDRNVERIMTRLLHEAARNRMSVHEVAEASGLTRAQVRTKMRAMGLNPRDGKMLLADKAAKALHENAELLGVQPNEIDLMSALAYLPMGEEMRRELAAQRASRVTALGEIEVEEEECPNCGVTFLCRNCGAPA